MTYGGVGIGQDGRVDSLKFSATRWRLTSWEVHSGGRSHCAGKLIRGGAMSSRGATLSTMMLDVRMPKNLKVDKGSRNVCL